MDAIDRLGRFLNRFAFAVCLGTEAWVFSLLWNWFVIRLGLPAIDFFTSFGIILTVQFISIINNFRHYYEEAEREKAEEDEAEEEDRPIWAQKFTRRLTLVFFCLLIAGTGWAWNAASTAGANASQPPTSATNSTGRSLASLLSSLTGSQGSGA